MLKKVDIEYLRSSFFGIEDALVSTSGTVIGISIGDQNPKVIILAGIVVVMVEAISMAVGQFLTDETIHEAEPKNTPKDNPIVSAVIMFFSYFLAGVIPVLPFMFTDVSAARVISFLTALAGLFTLGVIKAKIVHVSAIRSGLKPLLLGGVAAGVGAVVGLFFKLS